MSEKYTVYIDNRTRVYVIISKEDYAKDCTPTVYCNYGKEADIICRLLNEDDKRKSQPKIDNEVKKIMLDCLNAVLRYGIRHTDFNIEYLKNGIKIIESLESEE